MNQPSDSRSTVEDLLRVWPLPDPPRRVVRLGLLGVGWVVRTCHLPAISFLQARGWPIEIAAVCDRDPPALRRSRESFPGAAEFTAADAFLAEANIGACLIALWPPLAGEMTRVAIARGLHVLVEKPVLHDGAALQALEQQVEARKAMVAVAYNRRWMPLARPLWQTCRERRPDFVRALLYRGARDESGFYADVLVHPLDFVRGLCGELAFETGSWLPPHPGRRISAGARLHLRSAHGTAVEIDVRPQAGRWRESYELGFSDETWELGYLSMINRHPCDVAAADCWRNGVHETFGVIDSAAPSDAQLLARGFVHQIAAFAVATESGSLPGEAATLRDARRAMELCHEAGVRDETPTG